MCLLFFLLRLLLCTLLSRLGGGCNLALPSFGTRAGINLGSSGKNVVVTIFEILRVGSLAMENSHLNLSVQNIEPSIQENVDLLGFRVTLTGIVQCAK